MNHIAILLLILLANFSIGQVSTSQKKKIEKVVGQDFVQLLSRSNYPFALHPETCIVVASTTYVGDTTGLLFNNEYVLFRHPFPAIKHSLSTTGNSPSINSILKKIAGKISSILRRNNLRPFNAEK